MKGDLAVALRRTSNEACGQSTDKPVLIHHQVPTSNSGATISVNGPEKIPTHTVVLIIQRSMKIRRGFQSNIVEGHGMAITRKQILWNTIVNESALETMGISPDKAVGMKIRNLG